MKLNDAQIKRAVLDELSWLPGLDSAHIGVTADAGCVTLTGRVASYPQKVQAAQAALRVRGVRAIAQEIVVHTEWSSLTDSDIAREAGQALDRAIDVPDSVKASVHEKVVTLNGVVTWQFEREAAAQAVHHLKGVTALLNAIRLRPAVRVAGVKNDIRSALLRNVGVEADKISVTTDEMGTITLAGSVQSWAERTEAELVSWSAPGATAIINNLDVQN